MTLDPKALQTALDVFEIETKINSKSLKHGLSEAIAAYLSTPIASAGADDGVYAGMLVDMGTGKRWMTFGWAMGRREIAVEMARLAALSLPAPGEGEARNIKGIRDCLEAIEYASGNCIKEHGQKTVNELAKVALSYLDDALSTPAAPELGAVKVKPLDETQRQGWRDDKGRFCIPLSDGLSQDRE